MSDTPRTDGIEFVAQKGMMPPYNTVPSAFARTLERELAAANAEIVSLLSQDSDATQRMAERLAKAKASLAALEMENAALVANHAEDLAAAQARIKELEANQCEKEPVNPDDVQHVDEPLYRKKNQ